MACGNLMSTVDGESNGCGSDHDELLTAYISVVNIKSLIKRVVLSQSSVYPKHSVCRV